MAYMKNQMTIGMQIWYTLGSENLLEQQEISELEQQEISESQQWSSEKHQEEQSKATEP